MLLDSLKISVIRSEPLPPDEAKAADIFARIGYTIEDALADLVDNSIDAKAKNVLIRFVRSSTGIHSILIADDGKGMDDKTLREAMRFGSRTTKGKVELGKYGIGLKSASLSQAQTVTVLSRQHGKTLGRRWTTENIRKGWQCDVLDHVQCNKLFSSDLGAVRIGLNGTIIVWEHLEHLKAQKDTLSRVLDRTIQRVSNELGLKFHRFLAKKSGSIGIYIDQQDVMEETAGIPIPIRPLDPFSYQASGSKDYPQTLEITLQNNQTLELECHIWPPKSSAPGYKLGGGKVASRQGFYFYRNDRLIQAGGWNSCQSDDAEPHLSLARVRIELPSSLDSLFKLDIAKSMMDPPAAFLPALEAANAGGFTFRKYIRDADSVYRQQKKKESAKFPYIPGAGFPAKARTKIKTVLKELGVATPEEVSFKWRALGPDEVVLIDNENLELVLNSRYKKSLESASSDDAALVKLLMLLLFQPNLKKSFETEKGRDWLQRVNLALLMTLKR